ncbi:RdRP-domain-containing protein [Pleomassaria siparia CBS 279.74]|uniref:RNA-dependent RNA polymerase n=1 Tax=Pleomassaria siparia CBS 279.74 TaxID=1314801 RepID=A0A6G1JTY5_9PLEO|nr:RdRP-domain-containing protein [Pleomassaria siparia CBS 279.74]
MAGVGRGRANTHSIIRSPDVGQGPQQHRANWNSQASQSNFQRDYNGAAGSRTSSPNPNRPASHGPQGQRTLERALTRTNGQNWAHQQESKFRIHGIPRGYWTNDVHQALSRYGNITRIEMQPNNVGSSAWVTFQPPPTHRIENEHVKFARARVRIEPLNVRPFTVPSPVNPSKVYNELNIVYANSIDFGVRVEDKSMMIMRTAEATNQVQMALNLKRKEIDIQFPLMVDGRLTRLRFRVPLSLLGRIDRVTKDEGQVTLVIPFESPPQFFMQAKPEEVYKTFSRSDRIWLDWYTWYRQTEVVKQVDRSRINTEPLMHLKDDAIIDIGRWTTYQLSFDAASLVGPKFAEFTSALADYGVPIVAQERYTFVDKTTPLLWSQLQDEISTTHPQFEPSAPGSAFDELATRQIHLAFPVRYQLEVCLSNGFLKEHTITNAFLTRLASMDPAEATYILEKVADRQILQQTVQYDGMKAFDVRVPGRISKNVPNYCVLSRAANITPTMIHVSSPVVETSNRIIRKHAADTDRFIRVKFSDEKTEGRVSQGDDRSEAVFERIKRAMNNGIVVAGRYYEFLAFGNSQFRENGAFFYAPTSSATADQIRVAMGEFSHIKTVAKFGARLGQCFSTTRFIHNVNVVIETIPDIERNGFTFTDGVGKLSRFLAQMAAEELGLQNPFDDPPSLYQFRLAGCKGVLAIDPSLMGTTINIRPSQYKFLGHAKGLEVIRASAYATANFNRQLIIVLSTLGVPDHIFIRKQQEMVNYLERATKEQTVALQRLSRNIDFNRTTLTMVAMILDGFMQSRDPFMMSLLQLWRAYHIKYLKEKARIVIEEGAFVLGSVDETATLRGHFDDPQSRLDATRDGKLETLPEIFLQISDPTKKGCYKVVEGVCILARNPSLHAGDIRVVRAVDVPALHHMKNVVVLPQTGDRDIANMCSGGDLDGDDYLVMWDTDFIPETINEPPMDFTPEKPQELDRPITVADMTDFFVKYMKNDSLAKIALAHLAQADLNPEGVNDEKCLELARLHSQAVDYSKSGLPAIMDRDLKPKRWPHFMENKYRTQSQIYTSKKILGMLYDQVKLVDFHPQYENEFDGRILTAFELDDAILNEVARIKEDYDSSLRRLMAKHAIQTEFEAWSVFVLSHNQETRDYTFAEEFGIVVKILKDTTRQSCREAAPEHGGISRFVAAMYTATANETRAALEECRKTKTVGGREVPVRKMDPEHMPLMSFPWVFYEELGRIATGSQLTRQPVVVHRGVQKHHKKQTDSDNKPTAETAGNVKTKEGITHFGELLKLDFSHTLPAATEDSEKASKPRLDSNYASNTGQGSEKTLNNTLQDSQSVTNGTPSGPTQFPIQKVAQGGGYNESENGTLPSRSESEQTEPRKEHSSEVEVRTAPKTSAMDRLKRWM